VAADRLVAVATAASKGTNQKHRLNDEEPGLAPGSSFQQKSNYASQINADSTVQSSG
jgi:hypothetical protein